MCMPLLQDAGAAALPGHVRAARNAIGNLLANSGSQARSSPIPIHPQHHQQQPHHAAQQQQQMPLLKRGPGRPPKLKVGSQVHAHMLGAVQRMTASRVPQ